MVIAAHGLACSMLAHWLSLAGGHRDQVRGVFLVAPTDPEAPQFSTGGFAPMVVPILEHRNGDEFFHKVGLFRRDRFLLSLPS